MNGDLEPAEANLFPGHAPAGLGDDGIIWVDALLEQEGTTRPLADVPPISADPWPSIRRHSACPEPDEEIAHKWDPRSADSRDRGNDTRAVALRIRSSQAHDPSIRDACPGTHVGTQFTADPRDVLVLLPDSECVNRRVEKEVAAVATAAQQPDGIRLRLIERLLPRPNTIPRQPLD
jgi:hypothetical protein